MAILRGDSASYFGQGPASSRPDPTNVAPGTVARYYATDTHTWWTWDGNTWIDETVTGLPESATRGDILYYNGTVWSRLAIGAQGAALSVDFGLPAWRAQGTQRYVPGVIYDGDIANAIWLQPHWNTLSVLDGVHVRAHSYISLDGAAISGGAVTLSLALDGFGFMTFALDNLYNLVGVPGISVPPGYTYLATVRITPHILQWIYAISGALLSLACGAAGATIQPASFGATAVMAHPDTVTSGVGPTGAGFYLLQNAISPADHSIPVSGTSSAPTGLVTSDIPALTMPAGHSSGLVFARLRYAGQGRLAEIYGLSNFIGVATVGTTGVLIDSWADAGSSYDTGNTYAEYFAYPSFVVEEVALGTASF